MKFLTYRTERHTVAHCQIKIRGEDTWFIEIHGLQSSAFHRARLPPHEWHSIKKKLTRLIHFVLLTTHAILRWHRTVQYNMIVQRSNATVQFFHYRVETVTWPTIFANLIQFDHAWSQLTLSLETHKIHQKCVRNYADAMKMHMGTVL